jgi:hypothetical protein
MKRSRDQIERLSCLIGSWKGRGIAAYPTIETTEYLEELDFEFVENDPSIFYNQKAWYVKDGSEKGEVLHLESGYIICKDKGLYELINAQNNGRTEVLKGLLSMFSGDTFHLAFESKEFSNDERMLKSGRDIYVDIDVLKYYVNMSTQRTPEFQHHLEATLMKTK